MAERLQPRPQIQIRSEVGVKTMVRPTEGASGDLGLLKGVPRFTAIPEGRTRVSVKPEIGTTGSADIFSRVVQKARELNKPIGVDDPGNPNWRKATDSYANGNCVELAWLEQDKRGLRDSKNPNGGTLSVSPKALKKFLQSIQSGKFSHV